MASSSSISNREGTATFWPMDGLLYDLWAICGVYRPARAR